MYVRGRWGYCVIRCKNDFNNLHWLQSTRAKGTFVIHICKSKAEPYGSLWMGGNYPEDDTASAEPLRSAFRPFDVHHCRMSVSLLITYSKSLSLVQLWRLDVVPLRHWCFGDRGFLPHKFLLTSDMYTNWHRSGDPVTTAWTSHRNWPSSHPRDEKGR